MTGIALPWQRWLLALPVTARADSPAAGSGPRMTGLRSPITSPKNPAKVSCTVFRARVARPHGYFLIGIMERCD
jgi:hypothetical protein